MAVQLNLARKWRSKQFDQVVGQDLSVRMLQNSLYLDQIFPVYLFSGQRGCGKTTTARIFAAALNCEKLQDFRKEPKKQKIPCLVCTSCAAMTTGNHPDFIEIDAASHTGVDNVRQIIDAASLMPVMGRKRLYLIDEAHMLSKAAFNAFLKILEEPPESVVFMLATTDPEKIIETVRSRCFQLFFPALDHEALLKHLQEVCSVEDIQADVCALRLIIKEAEGSARDALNILEQVRFSHAQVSKEAVLKVLGHLPEELLKELLVCLQAQDEKALFMLSEAAAFEKYNALAFWTALQEMVRALLFVAYGAGKDHEHYDYLKKIADTCSHEHILFWLQCLYDHELLLLKSTAQHGILQLMLLKMCNFDVKIKKNGSSVLMHNVSQEVDDLQSDIPVQSVQLSEVIQKPVEAVDNSPWHSFLADVGLLSDPLVASLFKQVTFKGYSQDTQQVSMVFAQDTPLFKEWVHESESAWLLMLRKYFGQEATPLISFEKSSLSGAAAAKKSDVYEKEKTIVHNNKQSAVSNVQERVPTARSGQQQPVSSAAKLKHFDVSDKEKWKMANELLETFGGTLVEVEGEQ